MNKQLLRIHYRAKRQNLSEVQHKAARKTLLKKAINLPHFKRSKHIALYLPNDGEIDPSLIIKKAWRMNKFVYLPVLDRIHKGHLNFVRYTPKSKMKKNQYGIPEPIFHRYLCIPARHLDLVFLPLVAFDHYKGRLGMGGGYYDRSFSFTRRVHTTKLLGCAHTCQHTDHIPKELWDIDIHGVIWG
jgi:5-formyltetrahydrofolate cyclo-ligase